MFKIIFVYLVIRDISRIIVSQRVYILGDLLGPRIPPPQHIQDCLPVGILLPRHHSEDFLQVHPTITFLTLRVSLGARVYIISGYIVI